METLNQESEAATFESPMASSPLPEKTGFMKELGKALKIIRLDGDTIASVSQSEPALKYGLVFMFLPNILLFILVLLSGAYLGFVSLLVSLGQTFLVISLSFLIARFLFKGRGRLGQFFRPAAYSFAFLFLTPIMVLIYAPLPAIAGLLAAATALLGLWNIIVLSKTLKYTQGIGLGKSAASVLLALLVLSLGLSAPQKAITEHDLEVRAPVVERQNGGQTGLENSFAAPQPRQEESPTWDDVNRETVMGGMSTHVMNQISNGIWSGNYYNPAVP